MKFTWQDGRDTTPPAATSGPVFRKRSACGQRKQGCSERETDRVAEFCGLERANAGSKKEIMHMHRPIYNVSKKRAIDLALSWHILTIQIAQRNHDIVSGRLSKPMKTLNPAKPWSPRDHFMGSGYYTHKGQCL